MGQTIPSSILHGCHLCPDDYHKFDIESYFSQIIDCISLADSVLERSCFRALKPFWSPELSLLKNQSYIKHKVWLDNVKPLVGTIHEEYIFSRSEYRRTLRREKRAKLQSANNKKLICGHFHKNSWVIQCKLQFRLNTAYSR